MTKYSAYRLWSGAEGSNYKYVGKEPSIYPFTDIQSAIDACNNTENNTIIIEAGVYTVTAQLTIAKTLNIIGNGPVIITGSLATSILDINKPAAGTLDTTIYMENLDFANTHATGDIITIDTDGGATGDLKVITKDCAFQTSGTGDIDIQQTTATINLYVHIIGSPWLPTLPHINANFKKAASYLKVYGYYLHTSLAVADSIDMGTANVAYIIELHNCYCNSAGVTTGGSASAIFRGFWLVNLSSGNPVVSLLGDFDATTASEIIMTGTLAV